MSMSRTRTTKTTYGFSRIGCDVPDCPAHIDGDNARSLRRHAVIDRGWICTSDGRDLCPSHGASA